MYAFSGSAFGGAIAVGSVGADRSYPELNVPQFLNDFGSARPWWLARGLHQRRVERYPFTKIEDFARDPSVLEEPWTIRMFQKVSR